MVDTLLGELARRILPMKGGMRRVVSTGVLQAEAGALLELERRAEM
jgi:hypothetical protein